MWWDVAPQMRAEWEGGDGTAAWVLLVGGYDAEAVRAAATNIPEGVVGFYRPAYSLSPGEIA